MFVANWKMNKLMAEARDFCHHFAENFQAADSKDVGIAPPVTAFPTVSEALLNTKGVMLGVQNVHWEESGAHTGELSIPMVRDLGAEFAIVGHSERRQFYGETDESVALRAAASLSNGLKTIVCIGESKEEYEAGKTEAVVTSQLIEACKHLRKSENLLIAYEPIWAIGTGLASTPENAEEVHSLIRSKLADIYDESSAKGIKILYGGSTKPGNIAELVSQPNIDGALVGGASLEPESFLELINNGRRAL